MPSPEKRYAPIIEAVFLDKYRKGMREVRFERDDLQRFADHLALKLPKNLGDLIYTFRYRRELPEAIRTKAPANEKWIIRPAGQARYCFALVRQPIIEPNPSLVEIKVPDATPGLIEAYALNDEQALLAKLRYNRLIDIFLGITCYSLQNHLRTRVKDLGQVETDEVYVGIDRGGAHYIVPVQAKGGRDRISVVQIEQDFAMCCAKFDSLISRPVAAQFMRDDLIALFEFVETPNEIAIAAERHYRLVAPEAISAEELKMYRTQLSMDRA